MESGGDMSITNSNSNFGNTSLHLLVSKDSLSTKIRVDTSLTLFLPRLYLQATKLSTSGILWMFKHLTPELTTLDCILLEMALRIQMIVQHLLSMDTELVLSLAKLYLLTLHVIQLNQLVLLSSRRLWNQMDSNLIQLVSRH